LDGYLKANKAVAKAAATNNFNRVLIEPNILKTQLKTDKNGKRDLQEGKTSRKRRYHWSR
jgi:murein endopeptidase